MSIIQKFNFFEVIVPAKEGMINNKGLYKPLHMLPVVHKASKETYKQTEREVSYEK